MYKVITFVDDVFELHDGHSQQPVISAKTIVFDADMKLV